MTKQLSLTLIMFVLSGTYQLLQGQSKPGQTAQLNVFSARAITAVYVHITLHTSDQQLVIPYCEDLLDGSKSLCSLDGAQLEVFTSQGWQAVKQRKTFGVLGGVRWDLVRSALIASNSKVDLRYEFSRTYFEVEPGQQLRVVVDAWPDEQSMKNREQSIKLTSQPFKCPRTGILP